MPPAIALKSAKLARRCQSNSMAQEYSVIVTLRRLFLDPRRVRCSASAARMLSISAWEGGHTPPEEWTAMRSQPIGALGPAAGMGIDLVGLLDRDGSRNTAISHAAYYHKWRTQLLAPQGAGRLIRKAHTCTGCRRNTSEMMRTH